MRCETSFFSLTLFKKHLTRFWPLWGVWLAGWLLALPVPLWNEAEWNGARGIAQRLDEALQITPWLIGLLAPIVAAAVYFHLFKAPAANFIGALPLRREGVFATAFLAGYTMIAVPILLTGFITVLVEWAVNAVAAAPLLTLLGGCLLQSFFWFSFATLCCVISGSAIAATSFYLIFNGVVIAMTYLIQNVLSAFLYGFSEFGEGVGKAVMWLTPVGMMSLNDQALSQMLTDISRIDVLWVYAAVGFLMLLAAVGLHHIRHAERAGDLIAFNAIRWVFRISVTLCGGLAFGLLLLALLFDGRWSLPDSGAVLAGCCAVAAVVSWFAAEMLLQKSFKVFKGHWKGALIGAACFILAICAIDMDWIGFTTRVPAPDQVESATASFEGWCDPIADALTYDADTVTDLIALHQYLVDHQDDVSSDRGDARYCRLVLDYDLGLTHLRREYSFWRSEGETLHDLSAAAMYRGLPILDKSLGVPAHISVDVPDNEDRPGLDCALTPVQAQAAWQALLDDYRAGRYRADDPMGEHNDSYIFLEWLDKDHQVSWRTIYVRPSATRLDRFLEDLQAGVYGEVDRADREVYEQTEEAEPYGEDLTPLPEVPEDAELVEPAPLETMPPAGANAPVIEAP